VHLPFLSTSEHRTRPEGYCKNAKNNVKSIVYGFNLLNMSQTNQQLPPSVYIVGAGPGDPDLLTVKAQKLLSVADIVLYADSLIPEKILEVCRPDAQIIRTAHLTLGEILPIIIAGVRSHKIVVRLQSGDPSLYSAVHEQIQLLAEANIAFEIIPGISTFQAAAAKLKVELTVPGLVQTIILTRTSGRTEVPTTEELSTLAAHRASLCLYLSARHVAEAADKLLVHYPADTPVAICFRIGWPDEKILIVTLAEIVTCTYVENLVRTTLYVISPALAPTKRQSRLYHPEYNHLFRSVETITSDKSTH